MNIHEFIETRLIDDYWKDHPMVIHVNLEIKKGNKLKGDNVTHRLLRFIPEEFVFAYLKIQNYAITNDLYCSAHFNCGCAKLIFNKELSPLDMMGSELDLVCDYHFRKYTLGV